ncbi:MAG: hypothetical protein HQK49_09385 [Oligoflexia bacterium]|nr:hypothetical protein [Oligoflexia bacterium]
MNDINIFLAIIIFNVIFIFCSSNALAFSSETKHSVEQKEQIEQKEQKEQKDSDRSKYYIIDQLLNNSVEKYSLSSANYLKGGNNSNIKYSLLFVEYNLDTQANLSDEDLFVFKGFAIYSTLKDVEDNYLHPPSNKSGFLKYPDFKEGYLIHSEKKFDFLLGRAFITNGVAELAGLAGNYNTVSFVASWMPTKIGVNQLRSDLYISDDKLSLYIIPKIDRSSVLPAGNRWEVATMINNNTNISDQSSDKLIDKYGYLLTYNGIFKSIDYLFELYHGDSSYWTFQYGSKADSYIKIDSKINEYIAGVAKNWDNFKLYHEMEYQQSVNQVNFDYFRTVSGYKIKEYSFSNKLSLDETELIMEYSYEKRYDKRSAQTYYSTSQLVELFSNSLKTNLKFTVNDRLYLSLFHCYAFKEGGMTYATTLSYTQSDTSSWKFIFTQFTGPNDSTYGNWKKNGSIFLNYTYIP